jgi:hypothetical protein
VSVGPPSDVTKEPGLIQILALAGGTEELYQPDLDLFVPGRFLKLIGPGPKVLQMSSALLSATFSSVRLSLA